jgi:hypothetical protein
MLAQCVAVLEATIELLTLTPETFSVPQQQLFVANMAASLRIEPTRVRNHPPHRISVCGGLGRCARWLTRRRLTERLRGGVGAGQIEITSIVPGSVVVSFVIYPERFETTFDDGEAAYATAALNNNALQLDDELGSYRVVSTAVSAPGIRCDPTASRSGFNATT